MRYTADHSSLSLLGSTALAAALLFTSSSALASSTYPGVIASKYSVTAPQCTLCHNNPAGGSGTATQPFASTMTGKGLTGGSATDLLGTLLDASTSDTDGDGVTDVDELKAGGDPNVSGGTPVEPPSYGCIEQNGSIAGPRSQSPRLASMAVAGLLAGFLFFRRRRLGSLSLPTGNSFGPGRASLVGPWCPQQVGHRGERLAMNLSPRPFNVSGIWR